MTTYTDSKIITLSSNSASVKYNSSFLSNVRFELSNLLKDEKDIMHRQICLQSAQIPYSFYIVNYTCDQFRIRNLSNSITYDYTIPVGNYNATSLITAITSAIATDFPSMVISLNKNNGILSFTNNSNFTIYNNFQYSIGTILGISNSTNLTSTSNTLTLTYPLNLLGIKVLEVKSSILTLNNISSVSGGQSILLASIPVSAVPFGMIDYSDKGNNQMTFMNTSLDEIDILITDGETGEFVNFNNIGWTMTFIIHLLRTTQPIQSNNLFKGISLHSLEIPRPEPANSEPVESIKENNENVPLE